MRIPQYNCASPDKNIISYLRCCTVWFPVGAYVSNHHIRKNLAVITNLGIKVHHTPQLSMPKFYSCSNLRLLA